MRTISALILIASACCAQTTPTVIQPSDTVKASRTTINDNFQGLYNDIAPLPTPSGAAGIGFQPTGGTVPVTVAAVLNSAFIYDIGFSSAALACASTKTIAVTSSALWSHMPTLSCAAPLWFPTGTGVKIRPASGQVVSLAGMITSAPGQQIFDISAGGSGSILLPGPKEEVWVNWFGVDTSGIVSSQPAYTAMIAAVANGSAQPSGVTLRATPGTYLLSSTVTFTSNYMLRFHGMGAATTFTWSGAANIPAIMVQDCLQCEFGDFNINGNSGHQLLYGIKTQNSGSGTRLTATLDRFININIQGVSDAGDGYITTGVYLGGGTDSNNDQQYFESVAVYNVSHSAFTINHTQVYDVAFNHCQYRAGGGSYGVEDIAGNFYWGGGSNGGGASISDFYYGGGNSATTIIDGGRYEGSPAFLITPGPSYNPFTLSLRNVNYAGDKLGCSAAAIKAHSCASAPGGAAITYLFAGQFTMKDCIFGTSASVAMTIFLQPFDSAHFNYASIEGTQFLTSNTTLATIFNLALPTSVTSSFQFNPSTDLTIKLALGLSQPVVTLTPNSATPSLTTGITRYFTLNTIATTLTGFPACVAGETFNVLVGDTNTSISSGTGGIVFNGATPIALLQGDNVQFTCTFDNAAAWMTVSKGR